VDEVDRLSEVQQKERGQQHERDTRQQPAAPWVRLDRSWDPSSPRTRGEGSVALTAFG